MNDPVRPVRFRTDIVIFESGKALDQLKGIKRRAQQKTSFLPLLLALLLLLVLKVHF
jgi:hypothetical protein